MSRKNLESTLGACLLIITAFGVLAGCGVPAAPTQVSLVGTATESPVPSSTATKTATPSPSPTSTPQPTITVASVSATPSTAPRRTSTPIVRALPSPTPTASMTPSPQSTVVLTPTETLAPEVTPTITPTPLFTPTPLPTPAGSSAWMNILLIGLDSVSNLRVQNTDVIIVLSIQQDTKQVAMLSIPRDLWVYIPTYGWSRINTAHKRGIANNYPGGGPGLLERTIEVNLGITIQHWARVDFQGFTRVIDELGGVDMTVPCPVNLIYKAPQPGSANVSEQILQPGVYHMDGATALRYVRTRRDGTDFDRARRQHQFLKAMWNQLRTPEIILRPDVLYNMYQAVTHSVTTDLKLGDVITLARVALGLKPQQIRSLYIGANQTINWTNADGWAVLLPRYDRIQQVVASMYAPPAPSTDEVATEATKIEVWNGTSRQQLDQIGADQVRWAGFNVVATGAADNPNYAHTQIVVLRDEPEVVQSLAKLLKVKAQDVIQQLDPNAPADIRVILGGDYDPCQ